MSYEALDYFLIMRRHCYEFLEQTVMDRAICQPHMNYFALSRLYKIQNHVAVHEDLCLEKVSLLQPPKKCQGHSCPLQTLISTVLGHPSFSFCWVTIVLSLIVPFRANCSYGVAGLEYMWVTRLHEVFTTFPNRSSCLAMI